jgi:hypothetical protein
MLLFIKCVSMQSMNLVIFRNHILGVLKFLNFARMLLYIMELHYIHFLTTDFFIFCAAV